MAAACCHARRSAGCSVSSCPVRQPAPASLRRRRPPAVLRPCRVGFKFGPVFADRPDIAERLIDDLMARVNGAQVQIDVPEPNTDALALAAGRGLIESFGCARMYRGPVPGLLIDHVYGVTSFEFG